MLRITLALMGAALLAGCGFADSRSAMPDFLRQPESKPREPDPRPDTVQLVRDNIGAIFAASAKPRNIVVAQPRRDRQGYGWTVCVKASVSGLSGAPIGLRTFVVSIDDGRIGNRRPAEAKDGCDAETYEPV